MVKGWQKDTILYGLQSRHNALILQLQLTGDQEMAKGSFQKKNDETYGIFHMLVDHHHHHPLPPYKHMENSFGILLLSKNDFWAILRLLFFPPKKV